ALTGAFRPGFVVALGFDLRPVDGAWPLVWSGSALALLAAAARRARARRNGFAMWLAVMCALTSAIALVAATRIRGRIVDHEVFWVSAVGALLLADKQGIAFAVDDQWSAMFGQAFARNGGEDGEVTISGSSRQPRLVFGR